MSEPSATASVEDESYSRPSAEDLAMYLDLAEIGKARADFLLQQAEQLAQTVVAPLPAGARTVVMSSAGRAYVNPQGTSYQAAGPFSIQGSSGGLYLTKDERRTLTSLAGRGAAFSINPTPPGAGVPGPVQVPPFPPPNATYVAEGETHHG